MKVNDVPNRLFRSLCLAALLGHAAPAALMAEADAGSYLAARQAGFANDYERAATYFDDALAGDPTNPGLLESAIIARIRLGDFAGTAPYLQTLSDEGLKSQIGNVARLVNAAEGGDWSSVHTLFESGETVGPLVDGLAQGWAFVGEGQMDQAIETFDEMIGTSGLKSYGLYHKALALAYVGDFEGADTILSMSAADGLQPTRRGVLAHAEVMNQLGRGPDALDLIDKSFGPSPDPVVALLRERIDAGESFVFSLIPDAKAGMAEMYLSVAQTLQSEADPSYVLIYARAAQALAPKDPEAILLSAQLLEALERYDLANATYSEIGPDNPAYLNAELGRAAALRSAGKLDQATEVLQALARSHPDVALVHASLGDILRQSKDMKGANAAYTTALSLYAADDVSAWFAHYTRGITFEQLGDWPAAEADFRKALELNPGQPSILNYLGYSLVERQENLDEALAMIEEAVAAQPDNGAIVDSLGWVLFRLGKYQESIVHMEQAAALEPVDPVVNDHLGDVLWSVGREQEARFQWQRALSFGPEEKDAVRIRRKLEIGLDAVLAEEGADPLAVAREDR